MIALSQQHLWCLKKQFPLLGRNWMSLLCCPLDGSSHHTSSDSLNASLVQEFCVIGVLKGIEVTITVEESANPRFHKPCKTSTFCSQRKSWTAATIQKQVDEEELVPVGRSDWATRIMVVHKRDGGIRICGDLKVSVLQTHCWPLKKF